MEKAIPLQDLPERVRNEAVMRLKPKKQLMLIAIDKCLGNIAAAAKLANIDRVTHYRWMESDPDYKTAVEATVNVTFEWDEARLLKYYRDNELKDIMFLLTTRGKSRGYGLYPMVKDKLATRNIEVSEQEAIQLLKQAKGL